MKLDFKSKMTEIEKKNSQAQGFTSEQYDGIKVTADNLTTEDRNLKKRT